MTAWKLWKPWHFHLSPKAVRYPFEYVYRELHARAVMLNLREMVLYVGDWEFSFQARLGLDLEDCSETYIKVKAQNKVLRKASRYITIPKKAMYKTIRRLMSWLYNKRWR